MQKSKLLSSLQTQGIMIMVNKKQMAYEYFTSMNGDRLFVKYSHPMGFYKYTLPLLITNFLIISPQIFSSNSCCLPSNFLLISALLHSYLLLSSELHLGRERWLEKYTHVYFVYRHKQNEVRTTQF